MGGVLFQDLVDAHFVGIGAVLVDVLQAVTEGGDREVRQGAFGVIAVVTFQASGQSAPFLVGELPPPTTVLECLQAILPIHAVSFLV